MNETKNRLRQKVKQPAGVMLSEIPGLNEAIARAQYEQFRTRENSLLGLTYDLCGIRARTMTIRDYVLLERYSSPFTNRVEPTMGDLALFLWVLSPQFLWFCNQRWIGFLQPVAAYFHGRKVRKMFGAKIPESSEQVVVKCFEYIDTMFFDSPPSMRGGGQSCLSYLTGWFDSLQSEYHFTNEQIWTMGLPELFQRLNAIRQRKNPAVPDFNKSTDSVQLWVIKGLRSKAFTMDELKTGKVKIPESFSHN